MISKFLQELLKSVLGFFGLVRKADIVPIPDSSAALRVELETYKSDPVMPLYVLARENPQARIELLRILVARVREDRLARKRLKRDLQ